MTYENRKTIKTTPKQIVNYWKEYLSDHMIGVEWEDAQEYCWRWWPVENTIVCSRFATDLFVWHPEFSPMPNLLRGMKNGTGNSVRYTLPAGSCSVI